MQKHIELFQPITDGVHLEITHHPISENQSCELQFKNGYYLQIKRKNMKRNYNFIKSVSRLLLGEVMIEYFSLQFLTANGWRRMKSRTQLLFQLEEKKLNEDVCVCVCEVLTPIYMFTKPSIKIPVPTHPDSLSQIL